MTQESRGFTAIQPAPLVQHPDAKAITVWLKSEFDALVIKLNAPSEVRLQVSRAAPDRPRQGMIVFADGTDWDPGSGEGLYVYKIAGWVFVA